MIYTTYSETIRDIFASIGSDHILVAEFKTSSSENATK